MDLLRYRRQDARPYHILHDIHLDLQGLHILFQPRLVITPDLAIGENIEPRKKLPVLRDQKKGKGFTGAVGDRKTSPLGLFVPLPGVTAVSYTHLDVYKRQEERSSCRPQHQ